MSRRLISSSLALTLTIGLGIPTTSAAEPPGPTVPTTSTSTTAEPAPRPTRRAGDRMVQAGVGVTLSGLLGYGLLAAGLGIGNQSEAELQSLAEREDIEARRDVIARGRLGNRLAIAGGVTAAVAMAVGIPLIVIGRRRHEASSPRAMVLVGGTSGGVGLRLRARF